MTNLKPLIARMEAGEDDYETERLMAEWFIESGIEQFWYENIPLWCRSIDAKLPWENIVLVRQYHDGTYGAVHRDENGEFHEARAPTEALARRLAALKARTGE